MNKVVIPNYPVRKLPIELKDAVGEATTVTITMEPDERTVRRSLSEIKSGLDALKKEGKIETVTPSEAVARVRELRDEWDS